MPDIFDTLDAPAQGGDVFDQLSPESTSQTPATDSALKTLGKAAWETVKEFVPKTPAEAAQFGLQLIPGAAAVSQTKHAAQALAEGKPMEALSGVPVAQRIPEIQAADKTPAMSYERMKAGLGTLADFAMLAGMGKIGAHPTEAVPEVATPEVPPVQEAPVEGTPETARFAPPETPQVETQPIGEQTNAIEPSNAQMEAGTTTLGEQEGASGGVEGPSSGDNVVGEAQREEARGNVPGEQPQPTGESVAPATSEANVQGLKLRTTISTNVGELPIRDPSENVTDTLEGHTSTPAGARIEYVPIRDISGGKTRDAKVSELTTEMGSDKGYISRIIVDANNNVVEGQHRLEALRNLGATEAPVVKIFGAEDFIPNVNAVKKVIKESGVTRSDQINQMTSHLGEALMDENGNVAELRSYDAPQGFEKAWNSAVTEIERQTQAAAQPVTGGVWFHSGDLPVGSEPNMPLYLSRSKEWAEGYAKPGSVTRQFKVKGKIRELKPGERDELVWNSPYSEQFRQQLIKEGYVGVSDPLASPNAQLAIIDPRALEPVSPAAAQPVTGGEAPIGAANRVAKAREQTGLLGEEGAPKPGIGVGWHESVNRGNALIDKGADAYKVADMFQKNGDISGDKMNVMRAWLERLQRANSEAKGALEQDPKNPELIKKAQDAQDAENSFWKAYQPMKTEWSKIGTGMQETRGVTDTDLLNQTSAEQVMREHLDRELTKSDKARAAKAVKDTRESNGATNQAFDRAVNEASRKAKGPLMTDDQLRKSLADTLKEVTC